MTLQDKKCKTYADTLSWKCQRTIVLIVWSIDSFYHSRKGSVAFPCHRQFYLFKRHFLWNVNMGKVFDVTGAGVYIFFYINRVKSVRFQSMSYESLGGGPSDPTLYLFGLPWSSRSPFPRSRFVVDITSQFYDRLSPYDIYAGFFSKFIYSKTRLFPTLYFPTYNGYYISFFMSKRHFWISKRTGEIWAEDRWDTSHSRRLPSVMRSPR